MNYTELLILAMLSVGGAVVPNSSFAQGEAAHSSMAMGNMADMGGMANMGNMANMAMPPHAGKGKAYTRSTASYQVPDVKLMDADSRPVSLHDSLDGPGPVMLNFIFATCTTICPVMSATFSNIQAKLGANSKMRLVSISIDPEHDTPATLKKYAHKFNAGPRWSMLTGSIEDSIAVQRAFDIYRGDKMNHEPVIFMHKGPNQPWVRIDGFITADDLLREYDKLASN